MNETSCALKQIKFTVLLSHFLHFTPWSIEFSGLVGLTQCLRLTTIFQVPWQTRVHKSCQTKQKHFGTIYI